MPNVSGRTLVALLAALWAAAVPATATAQQYPSKSIAILTSVAPGTPHCGWTDDGAVLRITFTPALRWEEFVRRLFAGEPAARLLHHFRDEIRLP